MTDLHTLNTHKIPVSDNFALVDPCDAALVREYSWHLGGTDKRYARTSSLGGQYMHRLIVAPGPGEFVDHVNGHCLDNRRVNLRIASRSDNAANIAITSNATGYKGVNFHPEKRTYQARLCKDGQIFRGPNRKKPEEAALDYDGLARGIHGPFAVVNFPIGTERGVERPGGVI